MGYKTLRTETTVEFIEKKSRFIALAAPVYTEDEATSIISSIRKMHSDANHNCFAYRLFDVATGLERQRYNDDGEPNGTAGMPILNVIKTNQLFNCIIIVTRYFGGIMLGAGGLVRAYGGAAGMAIKQAEIAEVKQYTKTTISMGYDISDKILRTIEASGFEVAEKIYAENARFVVPVEEGKVVQFGEMITQASDGKAIIELGENIWSR